MAQWFISAKKADFNKIAEKYNIDPVLARIIRNRDITEEEEIRKYLKGGRQDMYAPDLFKDIDKAVALLCDKIKEGVRIRVIGDYDADGICSSYILLRGISACGGNVDTVIPHRIKDGYGLNDSLIEEAHNDGIDTIITCDNGIAAASQVSYARELGMRVIITDHHEIPYEEEDGRRVYILPEADAVVNPKQEECNYPYKNVCGGVVAYKVVQALFSFLHPKDEMEIMEELLEIAAFATVCDVMELRDENRIIVKCGLQNMQHTRNQGLKALMEVCGLEGKPLSAYHIGFVLGPCINATGRLDTAKRALSLLSSRSRSEAVKIAAELKDLNDSRKEMTLKGTEEAVECIEKTDWKKDKVLVVYLPECHESLAGIIAGRLREQYGRPVFVLTKGEDGVKGSGRSIEGYHMYEEMVACKEYFTKYGGHKMAAGLSMEEENVERFRRKINEACRLTEEDFEEKVHIDAAMPFSYLTKERIGELGLLEPFGVGNSKPVFAQKNVHIINARIMGKNQNVGKYNIRDEEGGSYEMVYFGDLDKFHEFLSAQAGKENVVRMLEGGRGDIPISITYYPSINSYAGRESIQIVLQNYK
ncbi:single-stranded-DNA-specific exonuclease [Kineothrix alysoides]|uniref:Single-stranded-DNA-specific exonuclease RecJ n=1 Tax=Kineothrix alysoides TaxID=1469948 RepID=A0A4R1R3R3_9FIRM|nr:single-stranded-DNA-specific exonuclease RecJ [Kineothrix alysoides]TCL60096.1 single-stranded-DNA-specific exonuclease [Kineothrix alysoides]